MTVNTPLNSIDNTDNHSNMASPVTFALYHCVLMYFLHGFSSATVVRWSRVCGTDMLPAMELTKE